MSRLASERGFYVVLRIMEYLDVEDLAEFEAAATDLDVSLRDLAGPDCSKLQLTILRNTAERKQLGDFRLDMKRLWELCSEDLLKEVRCVVGLENFMPAADYVSLPMSTIKPLVAFNPKYDLAAIAQSETDSEEPKTFQVISYGGFVRQRAGQILYYDSGLGFDLDCPMYRFMSWNNSGTHLLVAVTTTHYTHLVDLWLFNFDPATCTVRKCLTAGLSLRGYLSVLTSNLWLTDNTFMWADNHSSPLYTLTINKNREITKALLVPSLCNLFDFQTASKSVANLEIDMRAAPYVTTDGEIFNRSANFGNLFATSSFGQNLDGIVPNYHPYLFCVLKCPVHFEEHDCIAVIDRKTLKTVMLLNVRGHVMEVKTVQHRIFVLFAELAEFVDSSEGQSGETPFSSYVRKVDKFDQCSFTVSIKRPPLPDFIDYTTKVLWFNSADPLQGKVELCPSCSLPEIPAYTDYLGGAQLESFRQTAFSNYMYPTKDFVAFVVEGEPADEAYGTEEVSCVSARLYTEHHFSPGRLYPSNLPRYTFFHPTRPVKYVHRGPRNWGNYFGLTSNAHYADMVAFHPPCNQIPFSDRVYTDPLICRLKPNDDGLHLMHHLAMEM